MFTFDSLAREDKCDYVELKFFTIQTDWKFHYARKQRRYEFLKHKWRALKSIKTIYQPTLRLHSQVRGENVGKHESERKEKHECPIRQTRPGQAKSSWDKTRQGKARCDKLKPTNRQNRIENTNINPHELTYLSCVSVYGCVFVYVWVCLWVSV